MISKLQQEFLTEAQNSPKLFRDLAKVEQYIAESYKTRALIELIQNADDAESTVFGIHYIENGLIVANNGRPFTIEDVESLCRSGASNKQRGGNTIGYRGIGFKSVVNLAKTIYVFSKPFQFYFDKAVTQSLLGDNFDVPLIRIPHPFDELKATQLSNSISDIKQKYSYTTVFVFLGLDQRLSTEELRSFDSSSLLFLNHLQQVRIALPDISKEIMLLHKTVNGERVTTVIRDSTPEEWAVLHSQDNPTVRVAFKQDENGIVSALREEAVIHSFTPTVEFAGAFIKINGDYSTDPSRKNVDFDEYSANSFSEASKIITDEIVRILNRQTVKPGFFIPFATATKEYGRFKTLLFKTCKEALEQTTIQFSKKDQGLFLFLRLKPEWLNYEDYEALCHDGLYALNQELLVTYPEIGVFLEALQCKTLNLDEMLQRFNSASISVTGCAQVFARLVRQAIYDLNENTVNVIRGLRFFPVRDEFLMADQIKSIDDLHPDFWNYVIANASLGDINFLLRKLGIPPKELPKVEHTHVPQSLTNQTPHFKKQPQIEKWRSAETNVAAYLEALSIVVKVSDVSKANLGHDLEIFLQDGHSIFVEVKSVSSYTDEIRLTNNEYASAHKYGERYYFAVVLTSDNFALKLIPNPIHTLDLEKRCERWSWYCGNYKDSLQDITQIDFYGR